MAETPSKNLKVETPHAGGPRGPFSYIVAILVLVAVGAYVIYDHYSGGERKKVLAVIENLRRAALSKDFQKVHDLLAPNGRVSVGKLAEVNDEWLRERLLYFSPTSVRVTHLKLDVFQSLAKANFVAEVQGIRWGGAGNKGYRVPVSLDLRLEDRRWKVSSIVVNPAEIEDW